MPGSMPLAIAKRRIGEAEPRHAEGDAEVHEPARQVVGRATFQAGVDPECEQRRGAGDDEDEGSRAHGCTTT